MTIAQIIVLLLAGPIGLMCLAKLLVTLIFKEVRDFQFIHAVLLVFCTLAVIVSFLGIRL